MQVRPEHAGLKATGGEHAPAGSAPAPAPGADLTVAQVGSCVLPVRAGATCYFPLLYSTGGETQMGRFGFAGWTLAMAKILIFGTMAGGSFHDWKGSIRQAHDPIASGIVALILSTIIIGLGSWLRAQSGGH